MKSGLEYIKKHRKRIDRLFDIFNTYLVYGKEYSVGSKVVRDCHLSDNAPGEEKKLMKNGRGF